MKIYEYNKCSTCKKALRFLSQQKISFQSFPIVENPPNENELRIMLKHVKERGGNVKNLFNTSGVLYRELGVSEKFKSGLSEEQAIQLLSKNGKLIKRPFLLSDTVGLIGFKEEEWKEALRFS